MTRPINVPAYPRPRNPTMYELARWLVDSGSHVRSPNDSIRTLGEWVGRYCLETHTSLDKHGYGQTWINNRVMRCHRVVYEGL